VALHVPCITRHRIQSCDMIWTNCIQAFHDKVHITSSLSHSPRAAPFTSSEDFRSPIGFYADVSVSQSAKFAGVSTSSWTQLMSKLKPMSNVLQVTPMRTAMTPDINPAHRLMTTTKTTTTTTTITTTTTYYNYYYTLLL